MGVRFIKTQVEEAGMRVTQVCPDSMPHGVLD